MHVLYLSWVVGSAGTSSLGFSSRGLCVGRVVGDGQDGVDHGGDEPKEEQDKVQDPRRLARTDVQGYGKRGQKERQDDQDPLWTAILANLVISVYLRTAVVIFRGRRVFFWKCQLLFRVHALNLTVPLAHPTHVQIIRLL